MVLGNFIDYCIQKQGVTEHFPFDNDTLVFKVSGKMFSLCSTSEFEYINLKCDPDKAVLLREEYPESVKPGWHMNKIHWNSVFVNKDLSDRKVLDLVDHSYQLIVNSLPKAQRLEFEKGGI